MDDGTAASACVGCTAPRQLIFDCIRRGLSYDEIARKEGLSVQRVRRILAEALEGAGRARKAPTTPSCSSTGWRSRWSISH